MQVAITSYADVCVIRQGFANPLPSPLFHMHIIFRLVEQKQFSRKAWPNHPHTLHLYTSRLCFTSQIGSWGRVAAEVYGRCGHHDARVLRGGNTATHCPCAGGPELPGRESSTLTNLSCPSAFAQPGADKWFGGVEVCVG